MSEQALKPKRNTSAKGALAERRAVLILESQGYEVERAPRVVVWIAGQPRSRRVDFWKCIDLIAISSDPQQPETRLIQVGRKQDMRAKERELTAFALRRKGTEARVEVWGFVPGRRPDGQRFKVTVHNGLEFADASDEVCVTDALLKARAA